jgi:hypothetical protein
LHGFDQDHKPQYDKLVGNVSLSYVLNNFASNGDLKVDASKYLARLAKKHEVEHDDH